MRMVSCLQPQAAQRIFGYLPLKAADAAFAALTAAHRTPEEVSELRLRSGRIGSLSLDRVNLPFDYCAAPEELHELVTRLCGGSLYASEDALRRGVLPLPGGCRAAVVCRHRVSEGKSVAELSFDALVFRVSCHTEGKSAELARFFREKRCGILLYAPPAVGKTTYLRDLATLLSRGNDPLRVALIDCRCELDDGRLPRDSLIDVLSGYTCAEGIECAARTLAPEVILTDELGDSGEREAVLYAACRGIPVIATCHAAVQEELMLCSDPVFCRAFPYLAALRRPVGATEFSIELTPSGGVP